MFQVLIESRYKLPEFFVMVLGDFFVENIPGLVQGYGGVHFCLLALNMCIQYKLIEFGYIIKSDSNYTCNI